MHLLRSIVIVVLCSMGGQLMAQYPGSSRNTPPGRSQRTPVETDTSQSNLLELDTTIYDHFSMYDVGNKVPYADTTLNDFHIYDPVRKGDIFGAQLGNLGSSARPLLFSVPYQRGVNFGYNNYDYYRIQRKDVRWYDVNRPYSDFTFSPVNGQQNFIVTAKFSRSFADSVSFNLDYQRMSQEGFYTNQNAKSTYLATGIRILRDKTDTYILGILNANNEEHNGGISDKTLFQQNLYNFRQRIPVNLSDANTRNNNLELSVNNYYHFKDSISDQINFSLRHEFAIEGGAFKFYDKTSGDIRNYEPFGFDTRGVRNRLGYFHLENGFYLKLDKKAFKLHGGLVYDFYKIDQDIRKYNKHNLFLKGNGSLSILNGTTIDVNAHLGLADNAGDLWLEGKVDLDLKKIGVLKGGLKIYRYEPTIIQQRAIFNATEFWDNNFSKLNGTGFYLHYESSKLGLEAKASIDAMDNAIFFDETRFPQQQSGVFTSSQLWIKEKIKLGPLHFHNTIGIQGFNSNIYNLPQWISEHSLFIEGKIFKRRMLARLGMDLRLMESYTPAAFAPELGVFYQQNSIKEDLFRILDVYASFKIDRFRVFARVENLNHLLLNDINYLVPNYPQFDFKFRFGAAWQIKD